MTVQRRVLYLPTAGCNEACIATASDIQ